MSKLAEIRRTPTGWATDPKERMSYYLYFAGQNAIYSLVSTYLTTYMLFIGVDPTKSGSVMIAVKIWDAVNDAIFGVIFDSVKFKSGKKFLPWLRISTVFIPITTILLFVIPRGSTEMTKLAWFAIAYILWDTAYTLCDVPIYGVITSMTENLDERGTMLSYKSIWAGVGTAFTTVVATVLVSDKIGLNYGVVALLVAVFAVGTMIPACIRIKERFGGEDDEAFTLRKMFSYLFKNKYLLIYYLGFFFYSACNVTNSMNLFVSYYLFHNELFSLVVGVLNVVPSLVISLLVPHIIRKMDKMKLYLISSAAAILLSGIIYVVGYNSIAAFIVLSTLRSIPLSIIGVVMFMFTPDCAEYGKYRSGIEAKGITFAIQTFMAKLTGAISGSMCLFILGLKSTGWVNYSVENFQELNQIGATQSDHALAVLWFTYAMIPAIGNLLALIAWLFYKLNDKDVQVMADCNSGKITREEAEQLLSRKY
ncbi:MAG: MFS transporter [Acutalibacteraceae bacterium]